MEGKIIFTGKSKKGTDFIIRYPSSGDALEMTQYLNTLSNERTFVTFQGEQIDIKDEEEYLKSILVKINEKTKVYLFIVINNKIAGIAGIDLGTRTQRHIGYLGISIAKEFRGEGIGKIFMEKIINEAIDNIKDLEIISLGLFSKNTKAYNMYKSFGFTHYGTLPQGTKLETGYDDEMFMHKRIK